MAYGLRFHPQVKVDLRRVPAATRRRIETAIEERLTADPARFGIPLQGTLHPYRKLRVGDHRVVFRIDGDIVSILAIRDRKDAYAEAKRRRS